MSTRDIFLNMIKETLSEQGEQVLQIASNTLAIPTLDKDKNEIWIKVVISIPKGTRDGEAFDGYEEEWDYKMKIKQKKIKEQKRLEKKRQAQKNKST